MNSFFLKRLKTGGLLVLFLLIGSLGFSQGLEDFTNCMADGSYRDGSFLGNNDITWTYVESRDKENTAGIDGKALMLRRVADDSKVTSSVIPNGIGDFSVKLYKGFTGQGDRQVELFVNGISQGTSTGFNDYDEHIFTVSGINITGDITIEIRNITSRQVIVDDISWTAYAEGNAGPEISNITQAPESGNVDPDDTVSVSATITDPDGVASASLFWGTSSGNLPNEIDMADAGSDEYLIENDIPAQVDGTTVYYHIVAVDANAEPETTTSLEQSYTSINPKPVISNIELDPIAGTITSLAPVMVSADVTDADGIATVELNWGLSSESLGNTITMTLDTGDSYSTISEIPALANGTTVYYTITATDTRAGSTTTIERNYSVTDPSLTISEIFQSPSASSVTNNDSVSVNAEITDSADVVSAELHWGTSVGIYTDIINMSLVSGDTFGTDTDIPAQIAGTTVYYVIMATNAFPTTTNSSEYSYTVVNPVPNIANIVQMPDSSSVTSADDVSVSADVTDNDAIASVTLRWGTTSGNLPNVINMSLGALDTYTVDSNIPARADGTTIYYQIEAVDANPFPATQTSAEMSYTVTDPLVFRIPYFNGLRNGTDVDNALAVGFTFTNTEIQETSDPYTRIDVGGKIVSPIINFSQYDNLTVSYSARTFGGNTNQALTVFVSNDDGVTYDLVDTHTFTSSYQPRQTTIDLSTLNSTSGRIKFEMTGGTNSIRFRDLSIYDGYVYFNDTWNPSDPADLQDPEANIYVMDGTAVLNIATVNNITVDAGATLEIQRILNINGNVTNNGEIIFLSTSDRTGELGPVSETSNFFGTGIVTSQRYMSANRGYRMVSSAVNTSTSIHSNWQEGATSNTDNPNPGFGTHITGSTVDQTNGFDATQTGNPSMFTVDVAAQQFVPVPNTDVDTLEAGNPYLLFVRGDRSIDLGDNEAEGETILRASGTLAHGVSIQSYETTDPGQFLMFGNPYQSAVDINSVFAGSININANNYFVYDPSLGDLGGYATVDLPTGTNAQGSEANQFLQVGQAAQVANLITGNAAVVFHQVDKAPGNYTATNATGNVLSAPNMLTVQLYTTERFNNGGSVHDGFAMIFDENNSNEITPMDALKPWNFAENFGIDHNGTNLSIERRAMPEEGELYPFFSTGYQHTDYTIKIKVDGLDTSFMYLEDYFMGSSTLLESGENSYGFTVDANDPLSIATDRFAIRTEARLDVNDNHMLAGIRLYPNPLSDTTFYINAPNLNGEQLNVNITDLSGRIIYEATLDCRDNRVSVPLNTDMASGIYLVTLNHGGEAQTLRLIKN